MKGFLNINKEKGMTSSDVVVKVRAILRKATGEKQKVGHFGTLDPMGTGVLPIAVGNATRLFDYSIEKVKIYQTTFKFGISTDTLDTEGKIEKTTQIIPTKEEIEKVLPSLIGEQDQMPPLYSAKSINGKRAYDLAREGKEFTLNTRKISIYYIKLLEKIADDEYKFEISCSGGTYIRSIARDLGEKLNSLAVMSSIHRIKSGEFLIEDSVSINEFELDPLKYLIPIDLAIKNYEKFIVDDDKVDKVLNGVKIPFKNLPTNYFVVICRGKVVGIGANEEGKLVIKTRL